MVQVVYNWLVELRIKFKKNLNNNLMMFSISMGKTSTKCASKQHLQHIFWFQNSELYLAYYNIYSFAFSLFLWNVLLLNLDASLWCSWAWWRGWKSKSRKIFKWDCKLCDSLRNNFCQESWANEHGQNLHIQLLLIFSFWDPSPLSSFYAKVNKVPTSLP